MKKYNKDASGVDYSKYTNFKYLYKWILSLIGRKLSCFRKGQRPTNFLKNGLKKIPINALIIGWFLILYHF